MEGTIVAGRWVIGAPMPRRTIVRSDPDVDAGVDEESDDGEPSEIGGPPGRSVLDPTVGTTLSAVPDDGVPDGPPDAGELVAACGVAPDDEEAPPLADVSGRRCAPAATAGATATGIDGSDDDATPDGLTTESGRALNRRAGAGTAEVEPDGTDSLAADEIGGDSDELGDDDTLDEGEDADADDDVDGAVAEGPAGAESLIASGAEPGKRKRCTPVGAGVGAADWRISSDGPVVRPPLAEGGRGVIVPLTTPVGASARRWCPSGAILVTGSASTANPVVIRLSGAVNGGGPLVRSIGAADRHAAGAAGAVGGGGDTSADAPPEASAPPDESAFFERRPKGQIAMFSSLRSCAG